MTTKPATPLPWHGNAIKGNRIVGDASTTDADKWHLNGGTNTISRIYRPQDAAYIVAACNNFPRLEAERAELVAALREILQYTLPSEMQEQHREAAALLARLGAA